MSDLVVIKKAVQRLMNERDEKELEARHAQLRVETIEDSHERMKTMDDALNQQEKALLEAYAIYDPDADVDFETALANARSMESIEHNFDKIGLVWTNQRKRLEYLAHEAAK